MAKLTYRRAQEFFMEPDCCPFCQSSNTEYKNVQYPNQHNILEMHECLECFKKFELRYTLDAVRVPDGEWMVSTDNAQELHVERNRAKEVSRRRK